MLTVENPANKGERNATDCKNGVAGVEFADISVCKEIDRGMHPGNQANPGSIGMVITY